MRITAGSPVHLTYCTNVHPGETWPETFASLERYVPAVKRLVSPEAPFGVGLRLSAAAAETLALSDNMQQFKAFVAENDCYVFTINGFPYGRFHDTRVKENVYLPDWQEEARLVYSNRLADILAELLPDGVDGSVSTVPGAFKPRVTDEAAVARMAELLARHAAHLAQLEERTGRVIRLALEPEPCCFLETIEETIAFFEDHLFSPRAADVIERATGRSPAESQAVLRRHLGVCFDVCHAAVEYEEEGALDRLLAVGIAVPKIQLSAALRLPEADPDAARLLAPFDDGVYFHQVVERGPAGLRRFTDLDEAFAAAGQAGTREWRVHFHVPVFSRDLGVFATTQDYLQAILARQRREPVSAHLEVETYTWGVLPDEFRQGDLAAEIAREIQWVRRELAA